MIYYNVQIGDNPVKKIDILTMVGDGPSGIEVKNYDNINLSIDNNLYLTQIDVNDSIKARIASYLQSGSGINIEYDANNLIISTNLNNLPVKNILSGSGVGVSSNNGIFTIAVTGNFGLTSEEVDDRVSNLLIAGQNILLNYNDSGNFLTVSAVGLQPSGNYSLVGHSHNSSDILDFMTAVSGLLPNTYDAAVPWTSNHTLADGTRYLVNDLVYENGRLYKANYENESIPTNSTLYWTDVGPGYRLNIDGRDIPNIPYPVTSVNGQTNDVELSTADLDDFANAVSGLIPSPNFTSLVGVSGVIVTHTGTDYTVSLNDPTINLAHITDLSSNAKTFLLTPSSNNLNALISDETGSGLLVFNNSPAFNGVPTVPTAASGTNTNQIASTSFVRTEISNLVDSAPSTLDTLNELAAALGDDPAFATTVTNLISGKVSKSGDVMTGTLQAPSGVFTKSIDIGGFWNRISSDENGLSVYSMAPVSITSENDLYMTGYSSIQLSSYFNIAFSTGPGEVVSWNGNTLSVEGHTHTSSNITNFNSSVSGLLPVKNIIAGTGIGINSTSGIYTISSNLNNVQEAASVVTTVFNKSGATIPKMSAVYINGGQGDQPTIALASASGEMVSSKTYGITKENINHMSVGKVIVAGALTGVNTDQFNPLAPQGDINGTTLWLSPTVAGGLTISKPSAPYHMVSVGTVVRTHQNEGVIEVRVQNGFELEELHNVEISGAVNGQFLQYNSATSLWTPSSSGNFNFLSINNSGISLSGHNHSYLDITNFASGVDSAVSTSLLSGDFINLIYDASGDTLTIKATGVQPSGNYAVSGHQHSVVDITNFNNAVSGLIPVKELLAGTGINISSTSGTYTLQSTITKANDIDDFNSSVSGLLPVKEILAGSNITITSISGIYTIQSSTSNSGVLELSKAIANSYVPADVPASAGNDLEYIYIFNTGSENYGLILPTAIDNKSVYTLKNNTTGTIFLKTTAQETIDGNLVVGLNRRYASISVISDGSNWIII